MKESVSVYAKNLSYAITALVFAAAVSRVSRAVERAVELHFSSVIVHEGEK